MDNFTEGLVCNLFKDDDKKYYVMKITELEGGKYALVAPVVPNSNPLTYDAKSMFCIKVAGDNSFEHVKDVSVVKTLVEMWTK